MAGEIYKWEGETKTLRDEFAMAALGGMLAYSYVNPMTGNYHENCDPAFVAKRTYEYADAMLQARLPSPSPVESNDAQ